MDFDSDKFNFGSSSHLIYEYYFTCNLNIKINYYNLVIALKN